MSDCIFCRIVAGESPAEVVASDARFLAFKDRHPLAPVHVLIAPRRHVASLSDLGEVGGDGVALFDFIATLAADLGVSDSGYRVVTNTGPDAGQKVMHLHWHLIGGAPLGGMA